MAVRASEHGWIEGHNIAVEYRYSQGNEKLFRDFAAESVRKRVHVIAAVGDPAVVAAKEATTTIPIVMVAGGDPVASGWLVTSHSRPGGNVTGMPIFTDELVGKQFEVLKELVPRAARVGVLLPVSAAERGPRSWTAAQVAARKLALTTERVPIDATEDFDAALGDIVKHCPDALLVLPGNALYINLPRIAEFAAKTRLPALYLFSEGVAAGGLMSYTTPLPDLFRRIAWYVDKILKGTKPADLPIEQPKRFEMGINLQAAKALGLTIPQSLLLRADHVIE